MPFTDSKLKVARKTLSDFLAHSLETDPFKTTKKQTKSEILKFCLILHNTKFDCMKQGNKLIHVELKEPIETKDGSLQRDFYFGSKVAIFDALSPEVLGITLGSLRSHIDLSKQPYRNSKVTIKQGEIRRKITNRGKRE